MKITEQLLCGQINIFDEVRGSEVLRPHRMQVAPGECVHTDPEAWTAFLAEQERAGVGAYLGLLNGEMHAWGDGGAVPPGAPRPAVQEGPLVRFPLRFDWERAAGVPLPAPVPSPMDSSAFSRVREEEKPEHPAPEYVGRWVVAREAHWGEGGLPLSSVPAPVLSLAEKARESSWEVEVRYARGTGIHAGHGTPTTLQHSIALRFGRHPLTDREARAVYVTPARKTAWSWSSLWVLGPEMPPCGALLMADFLAFLEDPQKPVTWFREREELAASKAQAAKRRAKAAPRRLQDGEAL